MTQELKLSVIVPVYKVEKFISKCIDSILNQTFSNFELILIDDGSPDKSGTICDEYAKKDNRIIVIHKANGGVSSARNVGLYMAKGEYIIFIDADDYIESNMFELMLQEAYNKNADVVICDFFIQWRLVNKKTKENINTQPKLFTLDLIKCDTTPSFCNKIIKKNLFINNDIDFPEGIILGEDYLTQIKLSTFYHLIFKIDIPLYHYVKTNSYSSMSYLKFKHIDDTVTTFDIMYDYLQEKQILNDEIIEAINIGKVRKKASLINNSKNKYRKHAFEIFPEIKNHDILKYISKYDRIIFKFISRNEYKIACILLQAKNNIIKLIQILKLRSI
ncbi:MAG: glycosyltransferase [Tissierellia bacterium]|nr:glycosyltransferase [Tissierellia bacterium]